MSNHTHPPVIRQEAVHEYLAVRQTQQRQGLERVQPIGEIDLCTAPFLRDALADVDRRAVPAVIVDLSKVEFLALVGVQVLQTAAERSTAAGRRMVVVAPTPLVQRVIGLTDLAGELTTFVSMSSALAALEQADMPVPAT